MILYCLAVICMLAWLRNVNIAILVSHVSWNVLTSSTLDARPCICSVALNGHARISNLHCLCLCCCALLHVKISLKCAHLSITIISQVLWLLIKIKINANWHTNIHTVDVHCDVLWFTREVLVPRARLYTGTSRQ